MPKRILLAEDDRNMRFMLQDNLQMAGYEVASFSDGLTATTGFLKGNYQLCLLDVMLPGRDGFEVAQDIRRRNLDIPIIFLTARAQKEDRIAGFKLGGDDYITKPFSIEELLLRIESIFKRVYRVNTMADEQFILRLGKLACDFGNQQIRVDERVIPLTNKEAKLLRLFCLHRNKIIGRDEIQKAIWEDEGYFVGRSMDVFISRLRKLLRDDASVSIISVHGVGYKLEAPDHPTEK
jgi:two-component system, OmpR family, response regulator